MLRWRMTIVLIIAVWFAVAFLAGCSLGRFIHYGESDRERGHCETQNRENTANYNSIKHIHTIKEINHDSRETRVKHGKRTH